MWRGYPHPRSGCREVPPSQVRGGVQPHTPSQVRLEHTLISGQDRGYPSHPGPRSGWGGVPQLEQYSGYPILGQDRAPPPPHQQDGGTPPIQVPGQDGGGGGVPELEQYSGYFLRGGRYASCVHAGGLSC